jgi:hypothetical protein
VGSRGRESERAAAAAAAIEERERESKSSIRRQRSLRWLLTIASFREARAGHARERGSGERESNMSSRASPECSAFWSSRSPAAESLPPLSLARRARLSSRSGSARGSSRSLGSSRVQRRGSHELQEEQHHRERGRRPSDSAYLEQKAKGTRGVETVKFRERTRGERVCTRGTPPPPPFFFFLRQPDHLSIFCERKEAARKGRGLYLLASIHLRDRSLETALTLDNTFYFCVLTARKKLFPRRALFP